jgi:hypothetical protein
MATAPMSYQSGLIESLRASAPARSGPGISFLPNQANGAALAPIAMRQMSGLINNPTRLQMPAYVPPFMGGGGGDGGSPAFMPDRLQFDMPVLDQIEPDVPDYTEDLFPPVDEPVAEPSPVPDSAPMEIVDLPPLEPIAEPFPVPDPVVPDIIDLPPLPDETPPEPNYDEIPEGTIDVVAPGSSQPARDAIDQIGDITEVGEPLDEWDRIELPVPDLTPPPVPEPSAPDGGGEGDPGGFGDFYVPPTIIRSVSPDPLDEWDEIELPEPEIPLPEIPAPSLSMSDAALLDLLMGLEMSDMDVSYMNY